MSLGSIHEFISSKSLANVRAPISIIPGWVHHPMPSRPSSQHIRSLSTNPKRSESPANRVSRAISTSALQTMAAVANVSRQPTPSPRHTSYTDDDDHLSTIPDPRSRTISPATGTPPSPSPHPDLSSEVATLSNKLINAINYQTNLDDTLSVTRHELEAAREKIRQLEQEAKNHNDQIASGLLVKSSVVGAERTKLLRIVTEEKKKREETEKEKKKIEQELENLSQALFEEANKV
jgi:Rab guanine nucleotide exchange factor SEC2